jgi:hydroxymethylglutaryl-CoA reductase (NADPH)
MLVAWVYLTPIVFVFVSIAFIWSRKDSKKQEPNTKQESSHVQEDDVTSTAETTPTSSAQSTTTTTTPNTSTTLETISTTSSLSVQEQSVKQMNTLLNQIENDPQWKQKLQTKKPSQKVEIPRGYGKKMINDRWKLLNQSDILKSIAKERAKSDDPNYPDPQKELLDDLTYQRSDLFKDNIENFIGTVKVPVGIAGPLRVNGLHAQGDFYIPLATTEAALVASISRGISCINQAGGATAAVIMEGVNRDPAFGFKNLIEVGQFMAWATKEFPNFKKQAEKSTRFGKLVDVKYTIEGNCVHMKCVYTSGDASGQNIVTIATENILNYISEHCPVKPQVQFLEGGMSGDKKGNQLVFNYVRGKRVVAEVVLPRSVCETTLHATPEQMYNVGQIAFRGLVMTGALGASCHFSNAITAMAIALGQDPACAAESHVGLARADVLPNGDFYVAVTLPNMLVATIGGGTKLPSQRACLEMMGLYGAGKANALAEVMACVCIAGELSLGAAVVSGDFAKAHKILARDTSLPINLKEDSLEEAFDKAQAMLVKLNNLPDKDAILDIYGLYKQATVGDINVSKPSFFSIDIKAKTKYQAWEKFKGLNKEAAMKKYIELVQKLVESDKKASQ